MPRWNISEKGKSSLIELQGALYTKHGRRFTQAEVIDYIFKHNPQLSKDVVLIGQKEDSSDFPRGKSDNEVLA